MRSLEHRMTVLGVVICLPLALLGARAADAWGPAGSDSARHGAETTDRIAAGGRVRISGGPSSQLYPGASVPIGLTLTNRTSHLVRLGRVKVSVKQVTAPNADALHPCTKADFAITQMRKKKLRLPKGRHSLVSLGLPSSRWPRLAMRNRPLNQDGCKGASLTLAFKARQFRHR